VLVVEDHAALANRIGEGLRAAGFAVGVVYDGAAAPLIGAPVREIRAAVTRRPTVLPRHRPTDGAAPRRLGCSPAGAAAAALPGPGSSHPPDRPAREGPDQRTDTEMTGTVTTSCGVSAGRCRYVPAGPIPARGYSCYCSVT
jgi:hypothetical protein